ncbi:MAG: hypothetical protein ACR2NM_05160 [Bythopirellula sp.]
MTVVCLVLGAQVASPVHAQRGREVLGGLLRDLIESELSKQQQKQADRQQQATTATVSTKGNQARGYFGEFRGESQRLADQLQRDASGIPGVRSHLAEVLRLRERSDSLSRRYAQPQPDAVLVQDIRQLDRDWRLTAYHLNQLNGLPDPCRESIRRLDDINRRCCDLFDVGPQFDRRNVVRLFDALAAEIHHLERDVEFELRSESKARQLTLQLSRLEARAKLLSDSAAEGDSYNVMVAEYKHFLNQWNNLSRRLTGLGDRHIDRTIDQVHEINHALHEQLLLPMVVDRSRLNHQAKQASHRVELLTEAFSLGMLTRIPDGAALIDIARVLHEETNHILQAIANNATEDELGEHWQVLDTAWREFDHYAEKIDSPRIRGLRKEISALIDAMRQDLGVQLAFDRRTVIRLAAELEGIAEQTQFHINQWQRRPGAHVDADLFRDAKQLTQACRHLHEQCAGSASQQHLARDCRELAEAWTRLRPRLLACNTVDQIALRRISDQANARLVRLQVMLEI